MGNRRAGAGRPKNITGIVLGGGLILFGLAAAALTLDLPGKPETYGSGRVKVGAPAPELALENLQGEVEALSDYLGQVVLVNNWALWCPPCKAEMPVLESYYEAHAADGFVLIAVEAGEPAEAVASFVDRQGLTFPVWLDPQNLSLAVFGNGSLPNSYVIDRSGTVRYAWIGPTMASGLDAYVTPLIRRE